MPRLGKYDKRVARAALESNAVDSTPYQNFRDTDTTPSPIGHGDYVGKNNKAFYQAEARRRVADLLPGGTDRLIDGVKANVRMDDTEDDAMDKLKAPNKRTFRN